MRSRDALSNYFEIAKVESTRDKCILTYHHGSRKYKHVFPKRRGPQNISKVESDGKCVTEEFLEFLGPGNNFHGSNPTPDLLGYEKGLTITFGNGDVREFGAFDRL